jgi:hypothetical protein
MKLRDCVRPRHPGRHPFTNLTDGATAGDQNARRLRVVREQRGRDVATGRALERRADEGRDERPAQRRIFENDHERAPPPFDAEHPDAGQGGFARELRHEIFERALRHLAHPSRRTATDGRTEGTPERFARRGGRRVGQLDQRGEWDEEQPIVARAGAHGAVSEIEANALGRVEGGSGHRGSLFYTSRSKKVSNRRSLVITRSRRTLSIRGPAAAALAAAAFRASAALAGAPSSLAPGDADGSPGADGGVGGQAPGLARGPLIEAAAPTEDECRGCSHVCSFRHPLCVEAPRGSAGAAALATLAAADRAWDAITGALAAPAPDGGVDGVWHIELAGAVEGGGEARLLERDPVARFDRGSSFARVDRALPPGCSLDLALARAVARGSLWRAAPATDEASARAETETLARLATPCAGADGDTDVFQAHPERAIVDRASPAYERGASLFFGWLDARFGAAPGALVVGLWALAPTRTPFDADRWAAAPTGFDVLRESLKDTLGQGSTLDDVFVRFAVVRASMTPAPRAAWHVAWPSEARRLASPLPVAPTGASYVLVDAQAASPRAKLRLEPQWEDFGRMRWVAVKLDAAGRSIGELPVASLDRTPHASMTIESLDGADRVLVVGVNVGSTERAFDPGDGEWEPHGWLLTLAGE